MAKAKQTPKRYILLPTSGLRETPDAPKVNEFLTMLNSNASVSPALSLKSKGGKNRKNFKLNVVDTIHEDGPKLVDINKEDIPELKMSYPGLRLIPEVFYYPQRFLPFRVAFKSAAAAATTKTSFVITGSKDVPVVGARVVVFTDFSTRAGAEGVTNTKGIASVALSSRTKVDRIYVYPKHSYWPYRISKPSLAGQPIKYALTPIDFAFTDSLAFFYPPSSLTWLTQPVTVGVIDTGVGPHRDLPNIQGQNMIKGQDVTAFTDVEGHGTHVAGIIGAQANRPAGMRGLGAGVKIRSYRVFADEKNGASNFDIMKAIVQAVADGCDLLNLSLGGGDEDQGVAAAISDAYKKGVICFIASGNDGRQPVSFPAADQFSLAISALGRNGLWPNNSTQADNVKGPAPSKDKKNFIADFSNIGPQISLTAPGVGIMSTFPGNFYAVMDGTSMACPAATGAAARLLAGDVAILTAARDINRSNEMMKLFSTNAQSLGFTSEFEGKGLLK